MREQTIILPPVGDSSAENQLLRSPHQGACTLSPYVILLMLLGLALAWHNRFILDDAFISFVYARSLAQGQGLTWFGSRVEGYSNYLWVLWLALGERMGANPISWAFCASISAFLVAIYALWRLTGLIFASELPRLMVVVLFVTNYTLLLHKLSASTPPRAPRESG